MARRPPTVEDWAHRGESGLKFTSENEAMMYAITRSDEEEIYGFRVATHSEMEYYWYFNIHACREAAEFFTYLADLAEGREEPEKVSKGVASGPIKRILEVG